MNIAYNDEFEENYDANLEEKNKHIQEVNELLVEKEGEI